MIGIGNVLTFLLLWILGLYPGLNSSSEHFDTILWSSGFLYCFCEIYYLIVIILQNNLIFCFGCCTEYLYEYFFFYLIGIHLTFWIWGLSSKLLILFRSNLLLNHTLDLRGTELSIGLFFGSWQLCFSFKFQNFLL